MARLTSDNDLVPERAPSCVLVACMLAAAGCGRIGFESDGSPDASMDTAADVGLADGRVDGVDAGDAGDADAADPDPDNDRIPSDEDNCPGTFNPDQHDEDADGVGDFCDNCPGRSNPLQEDDGETAAGSAADGVGDACDPHPDQPDDALLLFHSFTGPPPDDWLVIEGTWTAENDVLVQSETGLIAHILFDVGQTNVTAETSLQFLELGPPESTGGVSVRAREDTGAYDGHGCGARTPDTVSVTRTNNYSVELFERAPLGANVAVGVQYDVRETAQGDIITCTINGTQAQLTDGTYFGVTGIALTAVRSSVEFQYVAVYGMATQ